MANYSQSTLALQISNSDVTLTVQNGKGGLFQLNQLATLYAAGVIELVMLTALSGDTFTVTRAQAGTAAAAWPSGTQLIQGVTGSVAVAAVNSAIASFNAGVTMLGSAQQTSDGTANFNSVRKSYADATYYPASQSWQPALGYTPITKGWNANAVGIGWSGSYLYAVVDGVYKGMLWTSANYNPGSKAVINSNCNWNSGIWEVGRATAPVNQTATIDSGNPWVWEGMRTDSAQIGPYLRVVWLRNN